MLGILEHLLIYDLLRGVWHRDADAPHQTRSNVVGTRPSSEIGQHDLVWQMEWRRSPHLSVASPIHIGIVCSPTGSDSCRAVESRRNTRCRTYRLGQGGSWSPRSAPATRRRRDRRTVPSCWPNLPRDFDLSGPNRIRCGTASHSRWSHRKRHRCQTHVGSLHYADAQRRRQ